jgi:hypothetical protein
MSDIIGHNLLAARVDKNILSVVCVFRHDNWCWNKVRGINSDLLLSTLSL